VKANADLFIQYSFEKNKIAVDIKHKAASFVELVLRQPASGKQPYEKFSL